MKPSDAAKKVNINEICRFLETEKNLKPGFVGQIKNSIDIFLKNNLTTRK